jgi:phytoene desaturase
MHPKACSSVFSLVTFLEFHEGIWHPAGGFRALAQGIGRAAQDLGVTINLGRPVRQVLVEGGRAVGLLMGDGETVRADAVVLNADFGYGVRHLLPEGARGRYSDRKLSRMRFSCSTFMLYLGVSRRYDDLPHHQLYLADSIRNSADPGPAGAFLEEQDPSFYVCNPTPVDPGNAPEGHSTLFVLVPIPNTLGGVDWAARRQSYRDLIVGRMHKLGFEDVERHIVSERCYTAEDWRDEHRAHLGAVFNLIHSWRQLGPLRPHIRADGVRAMYWIGGAVHPGSGLMTIMEAARSAAHFIEEDLQVGR